MTQVTPKSVALAGIYPEELAIFASLFPEGTDFSQADCLRAAGHLNWQHWAHALLSAGRAIDYAVFADEALRTYRQRMDAPLENPYTTPGITAAHKGQIPAGYFACLALGFSRAWNGLSVSGLSLVPGGQWGQPRPLPVAPQAVS